MNVLLFILLILFACTSIVCSATIKNTNVIRLLLAITGVLLMINTMRCDSVSCDKYNLTDTVCRTVYSNSAVNYKNCMTYNTKKITNILVKEYKLK